MTDPIVQTEHVPSHVPPHIPARVAALAAQIGDEPIAWKEHTDGSIVIVFCNKGKRTFEKESEIDIPAVDIPAPIDDVQTEHVPSPPAPTGGLPPKPKKSRKG